MGILVSHCPRGNHRFCLWSYQDRHVWSTPKPEQTSSRAHVAAQPSSERCLLRVWRGWECQLLGYLIWVKPSSTTDAFNSPPFAAFDALELVVLIFALLLMCWHNLPTEVKITQQHSAAPLATAANSRKGSSLMFLADWRGRVKEHITDSKYKSSEIICCETDNSICFLWTTGGRFDSTHCSYHLLFLRLYCRQLVHGRLKLDRWESTCAEAPGSAQNWTTETYSRKKTKQKNL